MAVVFSTVLDPQFARPVKADDAIRTDYCTSSSSGSVADCALDSKSAFSQKACYDALKS